VLYQKERALVFSDPRQFGRVRFHRGNQPPTWWAQLPPALLSREFTMEVMKTFLHRHSRLPLKAALLLQGGFPGLGNWMADETLWRARLHPRRPAGKLSGAELETLWRALRFVCRQAMKRVARTGLDLPAGWLFHQRWERQGYCPRNGRALVRETIGGRTTAWCPTCQGG